MATDRTGRGAIDRRGGRRRVRMAAGAVVLGVLLATSFATATGARVIERERYSGSESVVETELCEFPIQIDRTFEGTLHFRVGKGKLAGAFFIHDNFSYHETWSANGTHFTVSGNGLFHETRAVPLGNGVFEFHAIEAGQPFVVRDADGNVLIRDRGVIRHTAIFDTLGDDEPGGVLIEELEPEFGGPHPGFFLDPTLACTLLAPGPA